jgi:hypothetical protein
MARLATRAFTRLPCQETNGTFIAVGARFSVNAAGDDEGALYSSANPGSALVAGLIWNFQGWNCDGAALKPSFNLADGLKIAFLP